MSHILGGPSQEGLKGVWMRTHLCLRGSLISLLCAGSMLLVSLPALATTVVALIDRRHHRAVIAADSLLVFKVAETSTQTCKIIAKPGCTFAMAGLFYKEYPAFNLQELADQACGLPGDLRHRADAFLDIAKDPVMNVAKYLAQNEPKFYRELAASNSGELVIVVFAGPDAGSSSIFARGYRLDPAGGIKEVSLDVTDANNGAGFFGGANSQIAAYIKAHPNWQSMDKVAAARKFVQLEIAAHPDWVGPPVSVITVNRLDQQKWVNAGVCAAHPGQPGKKQTKPQTEPVQPQPMGPTPPAQPQQPTTQPEQPPATPPAEQAQPTQPPPQP